MRKEHILTVSSTHAYRVTQNTERCIFILFALTVPTHKHQQTHTYCNLHGDADALQDALKGLAFVRCLLVPYRVPARLEPRGSLHMTAKEMTSHLTD